MIAFPSRSLVAGSKFDAGTLQPYLFFGGRCDEALAFDEQAIGATVAMKMRFSESPDPVPEGMLPPGV